MATADEYASPVDLVGRVRELEQEVGRLEFELAAARAIVVSRETEPADGDVSRETSTDVSRETGRRRRKN